MFVCFYIKKLGIILNYNVKHIKYKNNNNTDIYK